jgi:hypothetical protein
MNTNLAHDCCPPSPHPLLLAWHQLAARWSGHLEQVRRQREMDMMSELSEETLRDIGAPERWVERAAMRREVEESRLLALRQWRNG